MSKKNEWYKLTHDAYNNKYSWVIVEENDKGGANVKYRGFSSDTFRAAAEKIISSANNLTDYYVINPENENRVYKLSRVLYAANNCKWRSMVKLFAAAA